MTIKRILETTIYAAGLWWYANQLEYRSSGMIAVDLLVLIGAASAITMLHMVSNDFVDAMFFSKKRHKKSRAANSARVAKRRSRQ